MSSRADRARENGKKGGRPKGRRNNSTLKKEAAREAFRCRITSAIEPIADALLARAQGVRYFTIRNKKTGKYEIVTSPQQVIQALNSEDDNSGEFYTALPEVSAIKEALDRALDKAHEPAQQVTHSGTLVLKHELGS